MAGDAGHGASSGQSALTGSNRLSKSRLLIMFGFVTGAGKEFYEEKVKGKSDTARRKAVMALSDDDATKFALQENFEISDEQFGYTGYPGKSIRFNLIYETSAENLEEVYFDILERTRQQGGFPHQVKITDYFAASENSAFFGNSQQRVGLQQDRVQQFLANIGKFVKELFQMVRELRILDERLAMYNAAGGVGSKYCTREGDRYKFDENAPKPSMAADVSLKSVFTDLVEGGTKNPQSVFGLAQQVGFTLLPDLFFNEYVKTPLEVDDRIDKLQYNVAVKSVLKRKMFQYLTWKEKTYAELVSRRRFNIKYLRQHWTIIKLYMSWIKPYLRNIERLTMRTDMLEGPDIVSAFESAAIEVEFLAYQDPKDGYHPVICATFQFRSRPDMNARKEYQQGPIHTGRTNMVLRGYAWTKEELEAYRNMKKREEVELLALLDVQLADIMDSLGEEFEGYLKEAGEEILKEAESKTPKKQRNDGALAPFIALFGGVAQLAGAFLPAPSGGGHGHSKKPGSPGKAMGEAAGTAFRTYHTFKKSRRMLTW